MFRIELFVDDKKLASALRALAGVAIGDPKVLPVVNAEHKNGQLKATTDGDTVSMFTQWLKTHKELDKLRSYDFQSFCKDAGMSATSANYFARKMVEAGLVKRAGTGSGTYYKVIR